MSPASAMNLLHKLVVIEGFVLLAGFFGIVVYKIAIGEIPLAGLLDAKNPDGRPSFSPARLQLLIFTVGVAAYYLHAVVANPHRDSLPDLPQSVVAALGGSHAAYLGGKAVSVFIQPLLKRLK
jgi:glycerol uptake facilitator-like aquaporin